MFNEKIVLETIAKLTGKHLCPSPTQVPSCQFYGIFENTFFTEHFLQFPLMNSLDAQKCFFLKKHFLKKTT